MKAYPAYKPSGVEWFDIVPEGWAIKRIGACFEERRETVSDKDFAPLSVTMNGIVPQLETAAKTDDGDNRKLVRVGDFVINSRSDRKGSSGLSVHDGSVSLINTVLKPFGDIYPMFSHWLLRSRLFQEEYYRWGRGIVADLWSTRFGEMKQISIPLPPLPEQQAIAGFLDVEVGKIDALVAEQRRLIALLAEKRQAVISHAVTQGLNPSAPRKASGIDWLGDIPQGWEVVPLKRHWSVTDCKHVTAKFVEDGFPLASIREVQSRYVDLSDAKRTTFAFYDQLIEGGRKPHPGDLIFSRNATVGEVAQVSENHPEFAMGQDVCLLRRLDQRSSPDYLQAFIRSSIATTQIELLMIGSTFKRVNVEAIRNLLVVFPPFEEQNEIAAKVESITMEFDVLTSTSDSVISLLQERRAALISAAVTGKIDVTSFPPVGQG